MSGRVLRVNDAFCRITGYTAERLRARSFRDLSDPHDVDIDAAQNLKLFDGRIPTYQVEKRFQHAWGHSVWVLLNVSLVRDDHGLPLHLIAQVQDISERKALEGRLEHIVDHDFLTALFNGRRFEEALAQEAKSAARHGSGGAVRLIDLDQFKDANDRFGHKAGDDLLKTVAAALRAGAARPTSWHGWAVTVRDHPAPGRRRTSGVGRGRHREGVTPPDGDAGRTPDPGHGQRRRRAVAVARV